MITHEGTCKVLTEHVREVLDGSDAVLAIVRANGRCDSWKFLTSLPKPTLARYQRYFETLRDGNYLKSPEHMRHLRTAKDGVQVHELKVNTPSAVRLYVVPHGPGWLLTHGGPKVDTGRPLQQQIDRAERIYREWLKSQSTD